MAINILACDTGLGNFGWALCALSLCGDDLVIDPLEIGVITTAASGKKHKVLSVEDTARRVNEIVDALVPIVRNDARVVCLEGLSLPHNTGSAYKMGAAWGAMVALAHSHRLPVLQASPQAVKKAMCGKMTASKDEMIAAVRQRFGRFDELAMGIRAGALEHVADAVAVAVACMHDESLRIALAMQG